MGRVIVDVARDDVGGLLVDVVWAAFVVVKDAVDATGFVGRVGEVFDAALDAREREEVESVCVFLFPGLGEFRVVLQKSHHQKVI